MMKKIEKFKTSIFIALNFVLLLSVVGWVSYRDSGYPLETREEKVQWYSVEEGFKRAQSEGKYVIMDVYTDWCGWCKKMDADTYNNETVSEYLNAHFVLIKIRSWHFVSLYRLYRFNEM